MPQTLFALLASSRQGLRSSDRLARGAIDRVVKERRAELRLGSPGRILPAAGGALRRQGPAGAREGAGRSGTFRGEGGTVRPASEAGCWAGTGGGRGRRQSRPMFRSASGRLGLPDHGRGIILRKEVIQPQVPLRLPCYDLVPITGFTFGACPDGRRRLRVPPALVA